MIFWLEFPHKNILEFFLIFIFYWKSAHSAEEWLYTGPENWADINSSMSNTDSLGVLHHPSPLGVFRPGMLSPSFQTKYFF